MTAVGRLQSMMLALPPESWALVFVPGCGVRQVLFRLRPKADLNSHSFRRISARTSDPGRPGFLSSS
jgi:hypothetical protein